LEGRTSKRTLKISFFPQLFLTFFSPQIKFVRININSGSKKEKKTKDFKIAPCVRNTAARVSDTFRSFVVLW